MQQSLQPLSMQPDSSIQQHASIAQPVSYAEHASFHTYASTPLQHQSFSFASSTSTSMSLLYSSSEYVHKAIERNQQILEHSSRILLELRHDGERRQKYQKYLQHQQPRLQSNSHNHCQSQSQSHPPPPHSQPQAQSQPSDFNQNMYMQGPSLVSSSSSPTSASASAPVQSPNNASANSIDQSFYSRRNYLEESTEEYNDDSSSDYYSSSEDDDEHAKNDELRRRPQVDIKGNGIEYERFLKWSRLHANLAGQLLNSGTIKPKGGNFTQAHNLHPQAMENKGGQKLNLPNHNNSAHNFAIPKHPQQMIEKQTTNLANKGAPQIRLTRASVLRMQHQLKMKNGDEDKPVLPQVSMNSYLQNFNQPSIPIPKLANAQSRALSPLLQNLHYQHDYPNASPPSNAIASPSFRLSPIPHARLPNFKPQRRSEEFEFANQSGSLSQRKSMKNNPRPTKQGPLSKSSRESQASAVADELRALGYNVD